MKIFSCMYCCLLFNVIFGMDGENPRINRDMLLEEMIYAIQSTPETVSKQERAIINQKFIEEQRKINEIMYPPEPDNRAISPSMYEMNKNK